MRRRDEVDEWYTGYVCSMITREMRSTRCLQLVASVGCMLIFAAGLAGSSQAAGACRNEALRTGPSASLPDCRAYELVTPTDKSSAVQDLDLRGMAALPAVNGERLALKTVVAFGSTPMANGSLSVFSRTPSGWKIISVPPPGAGSTFYEFPIFSPNLAQVGFTAESKEEPPLGQTLQFGAPGSPAFEPSIPYTTIATTANIHAGENELAGATPDFSHVFLSSTDHTLLSSIPTGTVAGAHDLYEWVDERLRLVNVTSEGSLLGECGAILEDVSEEGSRVIFESPDPGVSSSAPSCHEPTHLYMRTTEMVAGREEGQTVELSEPNEGVVENAGPHPVYFARATPDGSKVFFTTATELTEDDEGVKGEQLYEYDANAKAGERLTRITNGKTGEISSTGFEAGGVNHNAFISTDGLKVYFVTGKNAPQPNSIYRYNTVTKEMRPVAATAGTEAGGSAEEEFMEVAPNGNFFLFSTLQVRGLTDDSGDYEEVYRYDDENDSLTCVSCLPGGLQQNGKSWLRREEGTLETPDLTPNFTAISEDGSYVFFDSTQSLVPQAVNVDGETRGERVNNSDVYEWHNGVVSLIGSPTDQREQTLLGTSADGSNVFFLTHAQLVPQDVDNSADIYDARIDGGFPSSTESAACLGDTCQSVPVAPVEPTLGTSVFSGAGNLASPVAVKPKPKAKGCGKGRVRKKGRCVAQRGAKRAGSSARRHVKRDRGGSR
jgi:hypothetical protein